MTDEPKKILVVGGGTTGFATAIETLALAHEQGKAVDLTLITDRINFPTPAGSNLVFGIDGFGEDDAQANPNKDAILNMVRYGVARFVEIVRESGKDCRLDMHYQLVGNDDNPAQGTVEWLKDYFNYRDREFFDVPEADRIKFAGFTHAIGTNVIGQVCTPEAQDILIDLIKNLGGKIETGVTAGRHEFHDDGRITVHAVGPNGAKTYDASTLVDTSGGARLSQMGLPVPPVEHVYSGAVHVQLTAEDAANISRDGRPVAFCDSAVDGNVFWGALDSKHVLTFGFDPSDEGETLQDAKIRSEQGLRDRFHTLFPQFGNKYDEAMTFSFAPMTKAENDMPIIGNYGGVIVNTGYAGRGLGQCFAGAWAIAEHIINGDDTKLRMLQDLNPPVQAPAPVADPTARLQARPPAAKK